MSWEVPTMRLKTSYFNPTLFKKNLTRFWPLWGGASGLGVLLPLYLLTELFQDGFRYYAGKGLEVTMAYYYGVSYAVPVISLFYAALCALAVWHYLYNPRSVGMLHSLPITRKGLFVTNFLSGMAMMLIPYAVTGGLLVLIFLAVGAFDPVGLLITILAVLGETFFYFCAASLVVFVTGNPFAFAAFYFVFHFLAAGAEWLLSELMTQFYFGVEQAYQGVIEFLSPTIYLYQNLGCHTVYEQIATPEGWIENGDIQSVTLTNGWLIAVYALAGAALLGFAWLLYRRRRSESATDVVAVGWMKPVFRYGVALCAAVCGGTLLYSLFFGFRFNATVRPVPMAVCMAAAGIVGYYIASMLLAKSLKVFRGSVRGVLITAAAAAAVCFAIEADPFGVETWVPEAGEVESAVINMYGHGGFRSELTDPAAIQKLLDTHRAIVAERDSLERGMNGDLWDSSFSFNVYYTLRDSGSQSARRFYRLPLSKEALVRSEAIQKAAALTSDPAVQESSVFSRVTGPEILEARLTGGYAGEVYNTRTRQIEGLDLTQEQAKVLEAAVRRDIQAGRVGKTMLMPDHAERQELVYAGSLSLNYNVVYRDGGGYEYASGYNRRNSVSVSFEISVYCTETVKALESMGILDSTHRLLTEAEYDRMERQEDGSWIYYEDQELYYPAGEGSVVYPEERAVYAERAY